MRTPPTPLPTPTPMMAPMATMATAMSAPTATPLLLAMPSLSLLHMPPMNPRRHPGREKEDDIHNPQPKTPLQHPARLADAHIPPRHHPQIPQRPEVQVHARPGHDGAAVGGGDEPEEVDGGDEGAGKGQVDDGDEARVGGRAVVAEEREDAPGQRDGRDDEHEQDGGGRHEVGVEVQVHEVGEHAHYGDLWCG